MNTARDTQNRIALLAYKHALRDHHQLIRLLRRGGRQVEPAQIAAWSRDERRLAAAWAILQQMGELWDLLPPATPRAVADLPPSPFRPSGL